MLEFLVLILAVVGLVWKIGNSSAKIVEKITDLALEVKEIKVETKYVRDDHDKLVVVEKTVSECEKDINAQHSKIRRLEDAG